MSITYTTVSSPAEVRQILELQAQNHVSSVSADDARSQGFVTVKHEPDVLLRMNQVAPSVIAKDDSRLAGYALIMPQSFASDVPILQPMFDLLGTLSWKDQPLRGNPRWFVMGQICVSEDYRGMGIFDGMYLKMKEVCRNDYDFIVTEIAERNTRSIRAHERVGFETLHIYADDLAGELWRVVVLQVN